MSEQLLQTLHRRSNHHGIVIVREAVLLDELRIDPDDLRAGLKELEDQRVVEVLSPLPFLVLKIAHLWSGKRSIASENAREIAVSDELAYSYSFNNKAIDKSKAIKAIANASP